MLPDLDDICAELRAHHRRRVFAMEQRKRADLSLMAFLRTQLGWRKDAPAAERSAIAANAAAIVDCAERILKGKGPAAVPDCYADWQSLVEGSVSARKPFDDIEKLATKEMERLAQLLPVWDNYAAHVRGFGARGLAVIVAEAGSLENYATHSKLWKRMGVAVMGAGDGLDDHRQGAPGAKAKAADWIAEGYSAARRSRMFVIGDVLVKVQGPYREIYLARKAYEIARAEELGLTVAPSAKIPASRKAEFRSDGHIHRRAQRYMEKRLLRDLWRAWRVEAEWVTPTGHDDVASPSEPFDAKAA